MNEDRMQTVEIELDYYDALCEASNKLQMIRKAMQDYMEVYRSTSGDPHLRSEFLTVLKAVFPYDYEYRLREVRSAKAKEEELTK